MSGKKYAVILGVYGKPADRFMGVGYKAQAPDVFERLKIAAKNPLISGLEIIEGPGDDVTPANKKQLASAIRDANLAVCAVNPNLWGEMQWGKGTLGAADARIRQQAVDRIRNAMDYAVEFSCDAVGIWPGQDGYDYTFEVDYEKQFDWWVEGIQACADHNPAIKIGLEYKPYEPRTHSTIDTGPKTLLMIQQINRKNVGLTLDVGHALVQHENLGEIVALAQRFGRLFHMHLNDNYSDWDWDMNFASVRIYEFIEMLYWLKRMGYSGWYSVDIFAYRTPADDSVYESLAWLDAMMDFVERTGQQKFSELIAQGDPIQVSRFFRKELMGK